MADKKRWILLEEEKVLTAAIDAGDEDPDKILRLQHVLEDLSVTGADAAEAKARRILYGLGFDGEMQTKATKLFSGRWCMRIFLARALFMEPAHHITTILVTRPFAPFIYILLTAKLTSLRITWI